MMRCAYSPVARAAARSIVRRITSALRQPARNYNFASNAYNSCFGNLPPVASDQLRKDAVAWVAQHDPQKWYTDPVRTRMNGADLPGGDSVVTVDAFNSENGRQVNSPKEVVDQVIAHMAAFAPPKHDYRAECRALEQELLGARAAELVGAQCLDFKKQDGITEIEESVEANSVERRLNDLLLADEESGKVTINRTPALIGCVSNFSIFLDLFRKTLRNLELGVPCVVLSRSNTTQHTFRWFQVLEELMAKHGVPAGLLSHVACDIPQQRRIMSASPGSPLYFTGSRPVAKAIKEICPKLMASTGGPNTMVASAWNEGIAGAVKMSAAIENAGQCTALRHLVADASEAELSSVFDSLAEYDSAQSSLANADFAGVLQGHPQQLVDGYTQHPNGKAAFVRRENALPGDDLDEMWRQVYVDLTAVPAAEMGTPAFAEKMGAWLVHHQPISLAVNGPDFPSAFTLMRSLFEKTCMVVYTVGDASSPALTAQARPQDAEIFGEFPPRSQMTSFTKFPVVGPSATPGYNATYTEAYLKDQAGKAGYTSFSALLGHVESEQTKGYLVVMLEYLQEAANGPRKCYGQRSGLWGLQRPPIDGTQTIVRAEAGSSVGDVLAYLLPFLATNAKSQVVLSVDPANSAVINALSSHEGLAVRQEPASAFQAAVKDTSKVWNSVTPGSCEYDLVGHHVSIMFALGHIKCVRSNDAEFYAAFENSDKWLRMA